MIINSFDSRFDLKVENSMQNIQIIRGRRAQLGDEGSGSAAGDRADHPGQRGLHHARTLMKQFTHCIVLSCKLPLSPNI